jgi:fatty-acid peroxygenase
MTKIPRLRSFDSTLALRREGYDFISRRCAELRTNIFATRLLLHPVICLRGAEAAEMFYAPGRFIRRGAMPQITLRLLQDRGSVQLLEGPTHRHRKELFLSFLFAPDQISRLCAIFRSEWLTAVLDWERRDEIVLLDEMNLLLTRSVMRWVGIPRHDKTPQVLCRELTAMIENAGSFGPNAWLALMKRRRTERFLITIVRNIRKRPASLPQMAPARIIALHRSMDGQLLPERSAAIEILNVLRPVVAIARYIVFCAMALARYPHLRQFMAEGNGAYLEKFVEEVRRLYPFFPIIGGRALRACHWKGYRIRKGAWVLLDLFGTNHDAARVPAPLRFSPRRAPSWRMQGFDFIPQGGGDVAQTHRCPGEAVTVALMMEATRLLARSIAYKVPRQNLALNLQRIPTRPGSGFVMRKVRRKKQAPAPSLLVAS